MEKCLELRACAVDSSVSAAYLSSLVVQSSEGGCVGQWQKPNGDNPVRTAVRFPMKLALHVHTEQGVLEAVTENISANGLLFVSDRLPDIDSRIEFTIAMPSAVMGSATDVTIHCIGRVVRHYLQNGEKKAAAVIDEYFLKA
jgi:hypothetical protein